MRETKIRVKVRTEDLRKAVEKHRADLQRTHDKSVETFADRERRYYAQVAQALRKAADAADKGRVNDRRHYDGTVSVPVQGYRPIKPQLDLSNIDRLIKTLAIAAEETIVIDADQAAAYFG